MAQRFWLLEERAGGYRLGSLATEPAFQEIAVSKEIGPAEIAAQVRETLASQGYRGEPVLFAVRASSCLVAVVPHTGRTMARNSQAMTYALEEFVPLAAEEMTCDFVTSANDALGVAIQSDQIRPLLVALQEAGVRIASIVPAAMLALQGYLGGQPRRERQLAVCQDGDHLDIFELVAGRPHAWRSFPATASDLVREIQLLGVLAQEPPVEEVIAGGLAEELQECLRSVAGTIPIDVESRSPQQASMAAGAAILAGRQEPWIELFRGELGTYDPYRSIRTTLRILAVASACLLLALSLAAWLRAGKYETLARNYQEEQERVFRRVLPKARVPIGIRSRLESEYRTLAGITGQMEGVPRLDSAAVLLWDALAALPEDLRFRVLEARAEPNRLYLDAEVRQHGDADLLATALRKRGLEVPEPRTEQLGDKGVSLVLSATRLAPEEQGKKKQGATP